LFFNDPVEHNEKQSHEMDQVTGYFVITISNSSAADSGGGRRDAAGLQGAHRVRRTAQNLHCEQYAIGDQ
jgi:hypothetical protein